MYLLSRMNVMIDFICMDSIDMRGARGREQNEKFLPIVDSTTQLCY